MPQSSGEESRLQLSSLVDGEVGTTEAAVLCSAWRDEAGARRSWHTYHLIGDALRSEELATDPARDCDFLAALRARLALEPIVLAPQLVAATAETGRGTRVSGGASFAGARRWKMPMTVAASVLAVTGVLMVARVSGLLPADSQSPTTLAQQVAQTGQRQGFVQPVESHQSPQAGTNSGLQTVSVTEGRGSSAVPSATDPTRGSLTAIQPQTLVANGQLIRDARLDQYLAAHKQFGGSTALGVPSGFLRSATSESRDR